MSDNFKKFLTFSKSERIGILTIVTIIVIMLIIKYLLVKIPPKQTAYFHNLDSIIELQQKSIDSIITLDSIKKAEREAAYAKRKSENKKWEQKDFKIRYKTPKNETKYWDSTGYQHFKSKKTISIIDINTADTTSLKELPGIGSSFAKRIVEYRDKLGGFVENEQLLEVYGMDTVRYNNIVNYVIVDSAFCTNKLNINYDSFKTLNRHPYLKYEQVKKIVNHREQKGIITSWEQLEKIVGDDIEPKLKKYVKF